MRQLLCALALLWPLASVGSVERASTDIGEITSLSRLHSLSASELASSKSLNVPFDVWRTSQGLRVLWHDNPRLPMVEARVYFDAGSARDGATPGLAAAVNSLMEQGTRRRSGQEVALGFERLGARFNRSSHRDMALFELVMLSDAEIREPAMALLAEVITRPVFAHADWLRLQDSMRVGSKQRKQSPAAIASRLFYESLYQAHPYGHPPSGTLGSINRIRLDDIRAFHARHYVANNGALVLVGDLRRAEAETLAETFAAKMASGRAAPLIAPPPNLGVSKRLHQSFNAEQTHVVLGQLGITRHDPDYFALIVANEVIAGGGFGSLLMRELREKRGLTYGVSSRFNVMRVNGPFQVNFSTRADQAEQALSLTQSILQQLQQEGLPAEDVTRAIDAIAQSFPLGLTTNSQIASYLGVIGFYDLPPTWLQN
ncbi:MAG: pitrilysin family protein, partial [Moraxellaceae bacterium]|nr:pitrilysin family protein [Moraxellaceae bacterium]